jgi:hypothetical protein
VEAGLKLYQEAGITGVEFPAGGRVIDILAVDAQNSLVVIELKVSKEYDRVIGQLLRYVAWVAENLAEPTQKVRGVIISREISGDLSMARSRVPDVELYEYDLSVTLKKVQPAAALDPRASVGRNTQSWQRAFRSHPPCSVSMHQMSEDTPPVSSGAPVREPDFARPSSCRACRTPAAPQDC